MAVCCAIAHRGESRRAVGWAKSFAIPSPWAIRARTPLTTRYGVMNPRRLAQALFRDGCAHRWLPSFLRPTIFPFNLADSDHIMAVPDFSSFLFHDHMFGVSGKGQDRFMVLPIDNCDSGPVGISRWLNAQIALVALSKLDHPLI